MAEERPDLVEDGSVVVDIQDGHIETANGLRDTVNHIKALEWQYISSINTCVCVSRRRYLKRRTAIVGGFDVDEGHFFPVRLVPVENLIRQSNQLIIIIIIIIINTLQSCFESCFNLASIQRLPYRIACISLAFNSSSNQLSMDDNYSLLIFPVWAWIRCRS